jgi:hypothetical protein
VIAEKANTNDTSSSFSTPFNISPQNRPSPSPSPFSFVKRRSSNLVDHVVNRIEKGTVQGRKRVPEKRRVKCVWTETTEQAERVGMNKTEEREEGYVTAQGYVEYNHNDLPSFITPISFSSTELFSPHITFLRTEG